MVSGSSRFFFNTGFRVPIGAKVISTGDSHGGFNGDGEFYLVFFGADKVLGPFLFGDGRKIGESVAKVKLVIVGDKRINNFGSKLFYC